MSYHHGNLRAELLARAEEVVAAGGVEALSLRSLARAVGVSHAAPQRHFPDRAALLDALAVEGFERLGEQLRSSSVAEGAFEERLIGSARVYVRFACDHPALLVLMYARKNSDPSDAVRVASDACAAVLLTLLAQSETALGDIERFGVIFLACLQGIAALAAGGSLPAAHPADGLIVDTVKRLLRGSSTD